MGRADLATWLSWPLALAVLAACLVVTWWGLFGDRTRGRRRCPRCWYDLSHTAGLTCPECGRVAARERQLHRRRRRLLPAALAALTAALGAAWTIEHHRHRGWLSMVPSRALVAALPLAGPGGGPVLDELGARAGRRALTAEQWRALIERCVSGDRRAPPAGPRWQEKYGRLVELAINAAPDRAALERRLLELPPHLDLRAPRTWPRDAKVCLDLELRHWWPDEAECLIELVPRSPGAPRITLHRARGRSHSSYPVVVDPPAAGPAGACVAFETVVQRRIGDGDWEEVERRELSVPIEIDGTLAGTLRPAGEETLDEAIRRVFAHGVVKWPAGRSPLRVQFDPRPTYLPEFEGTNIGVTIEIRRDEEVARRLDLWWRAGVPPPTRQSFGSVVVLEDPALVAQADESEDWTMVVRGDPELALRAGTAPRYWAGEFTVPLKVDRRRRAAPPRDWVEVMPGAPG